MIRTRPLYIAHPDLLINADATRGACRVGLLDEGGVPLAGYGPEEMDPITEDAVDQRLQWRQHPSVAELFGRWVTLDIRLNRAEVFAVRSASWVNGGR